MKKIQFLILLVVATAFTYPAKDLKLEYSFKVGDQYTWNQTSHQLIKQTIPQMGEMTVEVNNSGALNLKVIEVSSTGAKLEVQYTKLKMSTKASMGPGNVEMDSEGTEDNAQNKAVKAIINKPFFLTITKKGAVENVEGTENLFKDFDKVAADDASTSVMKQQLQQALSNESQKTAFSNAFIVYPDKKLKTGDTWTTSVSGKAMNFLTKTDNTMSLKTFDASQAVVDIDGKVIAGDDNKEIELPGGIKAKLKLEGKSAMQGKIDIKSGWATEIKGVNESKGTMTLLAGGMIPQDMLVPMEITQESEYKMVKK